MRWRNLSCRDNDTQRNQDRNREEPAKPASTEIARAGSGPNYSEGRNNDRADQID